MVYFQEDDIGTGQKRQPEQLSNGAIRLVLKPGSKGSLATAGSKSPVEDDVGVQKQEQHNKVRSWLHTKD